MLHDIWQAETCEDAHAALDLFIETFDAKYPKTAECLMKDCDELLTFHDFPAQRWQSIPHIKPDRKRDRQDPTKDQLHQWLP